MKPGEKILALFRGIGRCEWCGKWGNREPHHYYYRKFMGGGGHLNHRYNLVAVCRVCHDAIHFGHILKIDLLAVVSARERVSQDQIETTLHAIRRARK